MTDFNDRIQIFHLLIENADAEEAKAWLDEFIKLQTPFTVTSIRRGRGVE